MSPWVIGLNDESLHACLECADGPGPESIALLVVDVEFQGVTEPDREFRRAVVPEEKLHGIGEGVVISETVDGGNRRVMMLLGD